MNNSKENDSLYSPIPQAISVKRLCDKKVQFYIPAYQRGYKWGKSEVRALLADLDRYSPESDGAFYCLQPIVVRYDRNDNKWRVIDGQQRLTTLYIIISALNDNRENDNKLQNFRLDYQRQGSLDKLSVNIDDSCSEIYHLTQAYSIVKDWIKDEHKRLKLEGVLEGFIKFIWYNLDTLGNNEEDALKIEHDFFLNLNSGKISLTEAELIKALLLHKTIVETEEKIESRQIYQAEEWDRMERSLRQPAIWYFIAGRKELPSNAIDFLLELLWNSLPEDERTEYKDIDFPIFAWAEANDAQKVWRKLTNVYRRIMGWYQDPEIHNLIGYFAAKRGNKAYISSYLALFNHSEEGCSKIMNNKSFIQQLWKDALTDGDLVCSLEQLQNEVDYQSKICNYDYRQYDKVFNTLFLTNIIHCTISEKSGISQRFNFVQFNDSKMPWNVEHISPANPKDNIEILKRLEIFIEETKDINPIPEEVIRFREYLIRITSVLNMEQDFEKFLEKDYADYIYLKKILIPTEEEDTFQIKNLTLLTERCNKGIGNNFFFDKRQRLRCYQAEGQFIPQLTQNVFSKWYSKSASSPLFWSEKDRDDYQTALDDLCILAINHVRDLSQKD